MAPVQNESVHGQFLKVSMATFESTAENQDSLLNETLREFYSTESSSASTLASEAGPKTYAQSLLYGDSHQSTQRQPLHPSHQWKEQHKLIRRLAHTKESTSSSTNQGRSSDFQGKNEELEGDFVRDMTAFIDNF